MDRILIEYQMAYDRVARKLQNKVEESDMLQIMLKHAFLRLCLNNGATEADYCQNALFSREYCIMPLEELAERVFHAPFQYYLMKQGRHLCKSKEIFLINLQDEMQDDLHKIDQCWNNGHYCDFNLLGNMYEVLSTRKERKKAGRFYTDEAIVSKIIDETARKLDVCNEPFPRVLDPACGCGYFLTAAYDCLHDMFEKNLHSLRTLYGDEEYHVRTGNEFTIVNGKDYWTCDNLHNHLLNECLYGSDVDPVACTITKISLASKNLQSSVSGFNVVKADSLIKWEKAYDDEMNVTCLDGKKKHPAFNCEQLNLAREIKRFWSMEFDAVIGNPPWISLSRRHKVNISRNSLDYYLNTYMGSHYLDNMYEYFMERSLEKLKNGGLMSFVLPDRLCFNKNYHAVRKRLLDNYSIKTIMFNVNFKNVIADSMIITVKKEHPYGNETCMTDGNKECRCLQENFSSNPCCEMTMPGSVMEESIRKKMTEKHLSLGDACLTFTGFIGIKSLMAKEGEKDGYFMACKGENIGKYVPESCCYYPFQPSNLKGGTQSLEKLSCKNKIMVRKTGRNLIAALDEKGIIIEQSLYGLIVKRRAFSSLYVLALLNSKLLNWFYKSYLTTNSKSTPQIKKYDLDKLPLKVPSKTERNKIEKLVQEAIDAAKEGDQARLKRLGGIIDNEVFDLYGLNDSEVEFVLESH